MIKSMTGFGRGEYETADCRICVELKSVNHRYLDLNMKMPRKLNFLEGKIRSFLKERISRGKVDVFITCENYGEGAFSLKYNAALAGEYLKDLRLLAQQFDLEDDIRTSTLSRYPEVFVMEEEEPDEEEMWNRLSPALFEACECLSEGRQAEGEHLKCDISEKLDSLDACVDFIESRSDEVVDAYRIRLTEKIKELLGDASLDEGRILQEVTVYADKVCVDEETVRLRAHIRSMRKTLTFGGDVGRKLDFIAQEMNREANTILSKVGDVALSDTGIRLKTEIEKIREQVQNIE